MKRIIFALILTLTYITAVGFLPATAFAAPVNGDVCTTDYVNTLVGSDGEYYYRAGVQTSIKYHPDGSNSSFSHENFDGPRKHYRIMPDNQNNYYGYCIEQGVSYPDAQRYTGVDWKRDLYFANLPKTVQTGIMLATIFGRQPGKTVPVPGCNDDDWYWATQVIIWEYQQQLRLSPTIIQGNGHVTANYFKSTLDGRPAEKCYNYMLSAMEKYQKIPSFASNISGDAMINVLNWDSSKSLWQLTIKDANQVGRPLIFENSNVKFQQNGNDFTFFTTSKLALETIEFKNAVSLPSHELLIWGAATGTQAISTGAADPIHFFARFRTEQPGTFELQKTSEDGQTEGFEFKLIDSKGKTTYTKTNPEGIINQPLFPGEYVISETETQKYRTTPDKTIQIKENEMTNLKVTNILKKGQIEIQKNLKDTIQNQVQGENGAIFQVFSAKYPDFAGTPENLRDELTTDDSGKATSKELPLGDYIMRQTYAGNNITITPDIPVTITTDLETVLLSIDNLVQKCKIEIFKTDKTDTPLAGAVFTVRAAEDIISTRGIVRYPKGHLMTTITTDDKGMANTEWLYPGKYSIEEVKAPEGYQLPKEPITLISLEVENQYDPTFTKKIVIRNNVIEEFPLTGDISSAIDLRRLAIMLALSLIGLVIMAYHMRRQNKTLH